VIEPLIHATTPEEEHRKVSSPYGFGMLDVAATANMERLSRASQDIIRAQGFERIMPAMVDYPETFAERSDAEMFSIKDNSGERLALRNDITAQVIKGYVRQIERKHEQSLRKFYYAAPVYKDVRKNYPLPREIFQIGCEIIGENAEAHLEHLITLSQKILRDVFQLTSTTVIADIRFRNAFAAALGSEYIIAERRRDVPLLAKIMMEKYSIPDPDARRLASALFYPKPGAAIPSFPANMPNTLKSEFEISHSHAKKIVTTLEQGKVESYWQPLTEPRSSYYSGLYFETFVPGFTEPMVRGGVYNDLVRRYAPIDAGACGFAIDILSF
jgi:ATP phosphoribosyltransferase regulatory subunit